MYDYTKAYYIRGVFNVPVDEMGMVRFDKIDREIIQDYVPSFVSKIRLFKEGNLRISVSYTYFKTKNNELKLRTQGSWLESEFSSHFTLEDAELQELKNFMSGLRISFNFEKAFLQNAFELFEMSYYSFNYEIKALILLMSMEILFKSGKNCKSPCISENIASFFENTQDNFDKVYYELRNLWKTRNNIAHDGNSGLTHPEINKLNQKLRKYVRESIVKMDELGQNKDEIIAALKNKI